jgi:dihydroorotate dehydrogenase (NAD+) catalytic subunit
MDHPPDLSLTIGGVTLKNPVMPASGTFGYGPEYAEFVDPARLGAMVTKGVSLAPRSGNPPPRLWETPAGMLNAIGLENVGLRGFLRDKLPWLVERRATVAVNILGETPDEFARLAEGLSRAEGVHLLELNVSCPNVAAGGLAFGVDPDAAAKVTAAAVAAGDRPVMVKLSPQAPDIAAVARAVQDAGAAAISLINTIPSLAVDIDTRRPRLANVIGGLSGPAIKPVALRLVWQAARAVRVPVIGIGGVTTVRDALEFMLVGASGVQIGTANFINPRVTLDVIDGLETFFRERRMARLSDWVGTMDAG